MGGIGLIAALLMVLGLGSAVMVFKQSVDVERERLGRLADDLEAAEARAAQLRAELAYHRRPDYLATFADRLGLVPGEPVQLTTVDALPHRPEAEAGDSIARPFLVALPSGRRITLLRRPIEGSSP